MAFFTAKPGPSLIVPRKQDSVAAFYRLVRDFSLNAKPWDAAIRYFTLPDERYDTTLIAYRVYGRREEYMAVIAAAGLDNVADILYERLLILPPDTVLEAMKQRAGYQSMDYKRV